MILEPGFNLRCPPFLDPLHAIFCVLYTMKKKMERTYQYVLRRARFSVSLSPSHAPMLRTLFLLVAALAPPAVDGQALRTQNGSIILDIGGATLTLSGQTTGSSAAVLEYVTPSAMQASINTVVSLTQPQVKIHEENSCCIRFFREKFWFCCSHRVAIIAGARIARIVV